MRHHFVPRSTTQQRPLLSCDLESIQPAPLFQSHDLTNFALDLILTQNQE